MRNPLLQNAELLIVNAAGTYIYHSALKGLVYLCGEATRIPSTTEVPLKALQL
jgi:hypothetical protein